MVLPEELRIRSSITHVEKFTTVPRTPGIGSPSILDETIASDHIDILAYRGQLPNIDVWFSGCSQHNQWYCSRYLRGHSFNICQERYPDPYWVWTMAVYSWAVSSEMTVSPHNCFSGNTVSSEGRFPSLQLQRIEFGCSDGSRRRRLQIVDGWILAHKVVALLVSSGINVIWRKLLKWE